MYVLADQVMNVDLTGEYELQELPGTRPVYKHETHNLYLFYRDWWKVDTDNVFLQEEVETKGFISAQHVAACPEVIPLDSWQYAKKLAYQTQIVVRQGKNIYFFKTMSNKSVTVPEPCLPAQDLSCKNPGDYFTFDSTANSVGYVCNTG